MSNEQRHPASGTIDVEVRPEHKREQVQAISPYKKWDGTKQPIDPNHWVWKEKGVHTVDPRDVPPEESGITLICDRWSQEQIDAIPQRDLAVEAILREKRSRQAMVDGGVMESGVDEREIIRREELGIVSLVEPQIIMP